MTLHYFPSLTLFLDLPVCQLYIRQHKVLLSTVTEKLQSLLARPGVADLML